MKESQNGLNKLPSRLNPSKFGRIIAQKDAYEELATQDANELELLCILN